MIKKKYECDKCFSLYDKYSPRCPVCDLKAKIRTMIDSMLTKEDYNLVKRAIKEFPNLGARDTKVFEYHYNKVVATEAIRKNIR